MYIGIDLGGTNTAAALVDDEGIIKKRSSIRTDATGGAKTVTDGLLDVCERLLSDTSDVLLAIGIGVPGIVNDEAGEVVFTPNLPLSRESIAQQLSDRFNCPVRLGNDANCAALGETIAGGAKGTRDMALITLGTGIGGGLILGGRLQTGISGAGNELGHQVIIAGGRECGCGRFGCWESYASATGLRVTAAGFMETHKDSKLWELCAGMAEKIDGKAVFGAFRAGDQAAELTVAQYIGHLGAGIVNLINLFGPELICIGGGISNNWDCIEAPLKKLADTESYYRFSPEAPQTKIVKAKLGNDAGIIGAALLGRPI